MKTQDKVNAVARGESVDGVLIVWDDQDACNIGPAFRDGKESGGLEFVGWSGKTDGFENDTYHVAEFFDGDGRYLGPDQHGVYPTFCC